MLNYKKFIEENFLIDEAKSGKLVPFIFNKVQQKYYQELKDQGIEQGLSFPIRELILKARREGFSSLILGLFAADDVLSKHSTETCVISYKDDATKVFSKRYKGFITSFYAKQGVIDTKAIFEVDNGTELILRQTKARFYCGTASARTAGRGGVVHKLLFSEMAHYPDVERITAREIVEGTMRQVDIESGWVFGETTANGFGNHFEKTWALASKGESRFKSRFFGWRDFYTEEEFKMIASEFTDKLMLKQEYPETAEEAFLVTGSPYFDNECIAKYLSISLNPIELSTIGLTADKKVDYKSDPNGFVKVYTFPEAYHSYTIGGDVAQGIEGGDYSVLNVIDNKSLKTVAKFRGHLSPDRFVPIAFALGIYYNQAYIGIEVNGDGLWVNTELFKLGYPNLYYREVIDDITNRVGSKVGFKTDERTRPYILSELQKMLAQFPDIWTDKDFLQECLTFVRNRQGRPEAMNGKNDDIVFATAIAYEIRRNAPVAFDQPIVLPQTGESYVRARLDRLYKKSPQMVNQEDYF